MTATAPPTATRLLTPAEWAAERGISKATAYRRLRHNEMNGRDADHPHAYRDERGQWWVTPDIYDRVVYVEAPRDEAVAQLVRAEVATALRAALSQFETP